MTLAAGMRLGPYEIIAPLGAGGMGEVFLATDTRLGRKVALKSVNDADASSAGARARLLHEARAAATLNHPNIAGIYDVLDDGGRAIIVMEYVPGETLAERLDRGRPTHDEALTIATQLAHALVHAHAAGIIHRDLKPANVKVTPDGCVKVLDFGLARSTGLPHRATPDATTVAEDLLRSHAGMLAGTPAYMAPEQLLGRPADQRSDIYGLGVLLFHLLTGRLPFAAPDVFSLALAVTSAPTPRASDVDPRAPADLDAIVARAMAREPGARYQSAKGLLADLDHAAQPQVSPPGDVRTRRPQMATIAAALLVLALLGSMLWQRPRNDGTAATLSRHGSSTVVAVLPFENRTGDATRGYLAAGIAETLGTRLAALGSITVAAPPSLREGRKLAADVGAAARKLGAGLVVTGGVRQSETRTDVDIRLSRPDGTIVWGRTYEAAAADLFGIYGQLTEGLVAALDLTPTADAQAQITRPPSTSVDAYTEYLQGREWLDRPDLPGSTDRAVAAFERAVQKDGAFARAHAALGDALWQQFTATADTATAERARRAVERAVEIDTSDTLIRVSLANIYRGTGKAELAASELRQAIVLQPGNDNAHRLLAQTLASLGRDAEALSAFQRAIAIRPDYWRNHQALGAYYHRAARYRDAILAFRRAGELEPDSVAAFVNLGGSYQALGENAMALQAYARAPDDPNALSNVGTIHYAAGRFAEAVTAYQRACVIAPHRAEYFRNLGDAQARLGEREASTAAYRRAAALAADQVKLNPQDGRRLAQLAVYEAKLGRFAEAVRHATRAVSLQPGAAEVLYHAAVVRALCGNSEGAVTMLEGAIARGYSREIVRKDEDLASLRSKPSFGRLVKQVPQ